MERTAKLNRHTNGSRKEKIFLRTHTADLLLVATWIHLKTTICCGTVPAIHFSYWLFTSMRHAFGSNFSRTSTRLDLEDTDKSDNGTASLCTYKISLFWETVEQSKMKSETKSTIEQPCFTEKNLGFGLTSMIQPQSSLFSVFLGSVLVLVLHRLHQNCLSNSAWQKRFEHPIDWSW